MFAEVKPNQAITLTVAINGNAVIVVEERRNGIGHGDLEIEGRVEQILVVNPAGDSKFVIDGKTVIARPGTTSIREGNRARVVGEVELGRQVHVKGVWQTAVPPAPQEVLAWEIKLQGPGRTVAVPRPVAVSFARRDLHDQRRPPGWRDRAGGQRRQRRAAHLHHDRERQPRLGPGHRQRGRRVHRVQPGERPQRADAGAVPGPRHAAASGSTSAAR